MEARMAKLSNLVTETENTTKKDPIGANKQVRYFLKPVIHLFIVIFLINIIVFNYV